ncbi:lipase member H-like [Epargyreus clarus]|uniref:lipase member H-like n=1 Tax=Epargyreus clarus TaxID=520877 RepID=UPI003C302F49
MNFLIISLMSSLVLATQDSGYPAGFFADCPGMNRTTTLSDETKDSLSVVLIWPTRTLFGNSQATCKLSISGAACVARHLDFKKRKTMIFISGYLDASFSPLVRFIVSPYLKRGRNIIIVETFPVLLRSYPLAARLTKPIGNILGEFLAELTHRGMSPNKLELVGGSLGAHIASRAAVKYHYLTHKKPARLTGLDPAGPCFRNLPPSERFNPTAAQRVDALHTNMDVFGIADTVAQVDFYANGGEYQPAIAGNFLLPCFVPCSHIRAAFYWLYATSNTDKFIALRCDSVFHARRGDCYDGHIETNVLGPKTNFSRPGIYYLPIKAEKPFYFGEEGLVRKSFGLTNYLLNAVSDENLII